jgi:hypothetical protein
MQFLDAEKTVQEKGTDVGRSATRLSERDSAPLAEELRGEARLDGAPVVLTRRRRRDGCRVEVRVGGVRGDGV